MRIRIQGVLAALVVCAMSATAGEVTGKVTFDGAAPKGARLNMNADPVCSKAHKGTMRSEEVIVNDNGTLKNVLVYIKDGLGTRKFPAAEAKAELDQIGCVYTPRVLAVQTGQEVLIKNSDPTLHNVHSLSKNNPPFNIAQPKKGMVLTRKFDKSEIFKVKCEVHTWMGAHIGVFAHPFFAVTQGDGSFALNKVPAGEYTIEAWHEKYGTQTAKVKVAAAGAVTADFKFSGK